MSQETQRRWRLSRRQFLLGLGSGIGLLAVGTFLGRETLVREVRLVANQAFLSGEAPTAAPPTNPTIWFEIDADNLTHLYIPKIEMGQGVHTALAQIAADELELDWQRIQVHQADTTSGFDPALIFTFGSTSVTGLYQPIRKVAATMREMLRTEAAAQWDSPIDSIRCENSYCLRIDSDERKTYGEIVAAKQGDWHIPEEPPALKAASDFTYIGQSMPRVDFESKLTGKAIYGYDARQPNMLYGAIVRPPRYGAILSDAQIGTADTQAGVVAVIIQEGFAGIVAESRPQAYAALDHLDLTWEGGITTSQAELEAFIAIGDDDHGTLIQREGDTPQQLTNGTQHSAIYRTPMAAHAHLEPQAALADVTDNGVTIYCSTQSPEIAQNTVAEALAIEREQITVIPTYLGGSFGRKTGKDVAREAALLSQAAQRPVHVGWNRSEDSRYGASRPPTYHQLHAALDETGTIIALEHQIASGDVLFYTMEQDGSNVLPTVLGADPLAAYGSIIHYTIPHKQVIFHRRKMAIPTGFWRGLGSFPNTFAMESFMDELAHAAKIDPLQFRLNHLPEGDLGERQRAVLRAVATACDWDNLGDDTIGQGIALTYDRGTVVALVLTVRLDDNERIRPLHAWCAVDPGLVVNPDGATAQVQGQIVMALSASLYEQLTLEDGMLSNANFDRYPLITMRDTPDMDIILINSSDSPIGGMGEPVIGTVPAALSNALFNLTGQRRRDLPFA